MANRYWVGGSAAWDATAGTKWATTSGGAGGAAVPTAADDVFLDAASGAVTVTIAAGSSANCLSFVATGFTGTLVHGSNAVLRVNGPACTFSSTMTLTGCILAINGAGVTTTLTTAGKTIDGFLSTVANSTLVLADALTTNPSFGTITILGSFVTNNFTVSCSTFVNSNTNTRTLDLGSSSILLNASNATVWNTGTSSGLTMTANTAVITATGNTVAQFNLSSGFDFRGTSLVFTGNGTALPNTGFTCANFTRTGTASKTDALSVNGNIIVTGTLTLSGNSAVNRLNVSSGSVGTPRTITAAAVSLTNVDFTDITATNYPGWALGGTGGNLLNAQDSSLESAGVGNWTASAALTLARSTTFASDGSASLQATAVSSIGFQLLHSVSGVAVTAGKWYRFMAKGRIASGTRAWQMTVNWLGASGFISNQGPVAVTLNSSGWTEMGGMLQAPAGATAARIIFSGTATSGDVVYLDDIGIFDAQTSSWTGSSLGDALGNSGITFTTPITCYAAAPGNWSTLLWLASSLDWVLGGTGGNLLSADDSSFESTIGGWANTYDGNPTKSRTTAQAAVGSAALQITTVLVGTQDAESSRVAITAGLQYAATIRTRSGATVQSKRLIINWYDNVGAQITQTADTSSADTNTSWSTRSVAGTAPVGAVTASVCVRTASSAIGEIHYADAAALFQINSVRVPLPQDDVVLDAGSAAGTYATDMPRAGRNLTMTGFTRTLSITAAAVFYGSVVRGSAGTVLSPVPTSITLAGRGTHTITSNGGAWDNIHPFIINAVSGSYSLSDAFTATSNARALQVTSGSFDTNGFAITAGSLLSTGSLLRSINLRTSSLALSQTGIVFDMSGSNLTLAAASASATLIGVGTITKTWSGGSQSYGTLTYTVANSPGALVITGANTFGVLNVGPGRMLTLPSSTTTVVTNWNVAGSAYGYWRAQGLTTGQYTSVPDATALDITGDIDLRAKVALDDWTPGQNNVLIGKRSTNSDISYALMVRTDGTLGLQFSSNGSTAVSLVSTAATGIADGVTRWVRVTRVAATGAATFYTSTDGTTWTPLGAVVTSTAGNIWAGSGLVEFGSYNTGTSSGNEMMTGNYYRAQVLSGIGGTVVLDVDFTTKTVGADTFVCSTGQTVTFTGALAQVGDGRVVVNSSTSGTQAVLLSLTTILSGYLSIKDIAAGVAPTWSTGGTGGNVLSANASDSEAATAWTNNAGMTGVARTTTQAREGVASTVATAAAGGGTRRINNTPASSAVTPGLLYVTRASVRFGGIAPTVTGNPAGNWYNASDAIVGGQFSAASINAPALDTWYDLIGAAVAPATTVKVGAFFWFPGNGTLADGAVVYIDRVGVQPAHLASAGATSVDGGNNVGWAFSEPSEGWGVEMALA